MKGMRVGKMFSVGVGEERYMELDGRKDVLKKRGEMAPKELGEGGGFFYQYCEGLRIMV